MNKINAFVTAGLIIASIPTQAEILLGGVIEPVVTIEVNKLTAIEDLDLTRDTTQVIATTLENSNVPAGYNVAISTANNFTLVSPTSSETRIHYRLRFDGVDVETANNAGKPAYKSSAITDGKTHQDVSHDLVISYQGKPAEQITAGDYTDNIEITIQAN